MNYYRSTTSGEVFGLPVGLENTMPNFEAVVVISPEDREQVRAAIDALVAAGVLNPHRGEVSTNVQAALRSLITPPRPEVYEHLVTQERHDGEHVTVTSLCGKVWMPSVRADVKVLGRCPDCEQASIAGWVA